MESFIGLSIFLMTYCVSFLLPTVLMYQKLKAKTDAGKYFQNLLWAFISSPISPCIVIHPQSKTFIISSVASALAHLALLIFAYFMDVNTNRSITVDTSFFAVTGTAVAWREKKKSSIKSFTNALFS